MKHIINKRCNKMIIVSVSLLLSLFLMSPAYSQGVSAHRGDHLSAPENTLPAILSAVKAGSHQIEIDVKSTQDGVLVLMHDWTVDRTTDGTGKVADLTYEDIKALDAGSWFSNDFKDVRVPTFREALSVIPEEITVNVHAHGGIEIVEQTARIIAETDCLDNCFLTLGMDAFGEMAAARLAVPSIKLCKGHPADSTVVRDDTMIPVDAFTREGRVSTEKDINRKIDYFQLFGSPGSVEQLTASVKALHGFDVLVNYCCANSLAQIKPLIAAEVDYILTDNISLCLDVLGDYGIKPVRKK